MTGSETDAAPDEPPAALAAVGIISLLSVPCFLRMSPAAGAEVSGRAVASKLPGE